jgi:FkbM family methyltransferase
MIGLFSNYFAFLRKLYLNGNKVLFYLQLPLFFILIGFTWFVFAILRLFGKKNRIHIFPDKTMMIGKPSDVLFLFISLFGTFEPGITDPMKKWMADAKVFLDIGANIGYYSHLALRHNSNITVVAVEPSAKTSWYLHKNLSAFDSQRYSIVEKAISNENKTQNLYSGPFFNSGYASLHQKHGLKAESTIQSITFDKLLNEIEPKAKDIELIKIDVEGGEVEVLESVFESIDKLPKNVKILVEITPAWIDKGRIQQILGKYQAQGFSFVKVPNSYKASYFLKYKMEELLAPSSIEELMTEKNDVLLSRNN